MINFLKASRGLPAPMPYRLEPPPAPARSMTLTRSGTSLNEIANGVAPLILRDAAFDFDVAPVVKTISSTGARNWAAHDFPRTPRSNPLTKDVWEDLRRTHYSNVEMIGLMLAVFRYDLPASLGGPSYDLVASMSVNQVLSKNPPRTYSHHPNNAPNMGGQVHVEMIFLSQLAALVGAMRASSEQIKGQPVRPRGLQAGAVSISVDLMIQKQALCNPCYVTWRDYAIKEPMLADVTVTYQLI